MFMTTCINRILYPESIYLTTFPRYDIGAFALGYKPALLFHPVISIETQSSAAYQPVSDQSAPRPPHANSTNITSTHFARATHTRSSRHGLTAPQDRRQSRQVRSRRRSRYTLLDAIDDTRCISEPEMSRSQRRVFDVSWTDVCERHAEGTCTKGLSAGLFEVLCAHCRDAVVVF